LYLHTQGTREVAAAGVSVSQASTAQLGLKIYRFKDLIKEENIKKIYCKKLKISKGILVAPFSGAPLNI